MNYWLGSVTEGARLAPGLAAGIAMVWFLIPWTAQLVAHPDDVIRLQRLLEGEAVPSLFTTQQLIAGRIAACVMLAALVLLLLGLLTVLYHRLQFAVTLWPVAGIVIRPDRQFPVAAGARICRQARDRRRPAAGWPDPGLAACGRGMGPGLRVRPRQPALLSGSPVMLGRRGREEFEAGRAAVRAAAARGRADDRAISDVGAAPEAAVMPSPRRQAAPILRKSKACVRCLRKCMSSPSSRKRASPNWKPN